VQVRRICLHRGHGCRDHDGLSETINTAQLLLPRQLMLFTPGCWRTCWDA
jgi:hypothetical protein